MKNKLSFKRRINNIHFIIIMIFEASKTLLLVSILSRILNSFVSFFNGVLIIRLLLNMLSKKASFYEVFNILLVGIVINIGKIIYDSILSGFYNDKVSTKLTKDTQRKVFDKATKIKFEGFYQPEFYNSLSFTLGKITSIVWGVVDSLSSFIGSITSFCLNSVIILAGGGHQSFFLIAIMFLGLIASQLIQFRINKNIHQLGLDIRLPERKRDYSRRLFYSKKFAKEFKSTNAAEIFYNYFIENNRSITELLIKSGKKNAILTGINSILNSALLNIGVLIYLAYRLIVMQDISIGDFWGVYKGCSFIISSNIFSVLSSLHLHSLDIEKVREFLELTEEDLHSGINISDDEKILNIELVNVSFKYLGADDYALKNINLKIESGEKIALVGCNGAGKTTLALLLFRLYEPTEGKILLNGRDIKEFNLLSYRKLIGVTFQDFKLYPYTISENVLMNRKYSFKNYTKIVNESLEKCDLFKKISLLPKNIASIISKQFDEDGIVLSGGEQQKLAISRLFAKYNRILILDEPSSSLDPISEANINKRIIEHANGKTTIIITHRLSTVKDVDRIFLLDNGYLTENGTHKELLKLKGKYAEMFNIQAKYYTEEVEGKLG